MMPTPRILVIHNEGQYYFGAERVLEYYLSGLGGRAEVALAAPENSRVIEENAAHCRSVALPDDRRRFSPRLLLAQTRMLARFRQDFRFDLVHGWAARDWELTGLVGRRCGVPAVGTLHDHPEASFISPGRQRLMRWSSRYGLARVVCVSEAVQAACAAAGYRAKQLAVVRNGLPPAFFSSVAKKPSRCGDFTLGYLGSFSERKGVRGLFRILDALAELTDTPWTLRLAGGVTEEEGKKMVEEIREAYSGRSWWPRVRWEGWTERPMDFLSSVDLLVCPSSEFDPFPTVLLEAGAAGVPALAAKVGGVGEIVQDGGTGWLFEAGDWSGAARRVSHVLATPGALRKAGARARLRVEAEFSVDKMAGNYESLYRAAMAPCGGRDGAFPEA